MRVAGIILLTKVKRNFGVQDLKPEIWVFDELIKARNPQNKPAVLHLRPTVTPAISVSHMKQPPGPFSPHRGIFC